MDVNKMIKGKGTANKILERCLGKNEYGDNPKCQKCGRDTPHLHLFKVKGQMVCADCYRERQERTHGKLDTE